MSEVCAIWRFYAAHNGSFKPTFRDKLSVPTSRVKQFFDYMTVEDGTDRLSRNVGKKLPINTA